MIIRYAGTMQPRSLAALSRLRGRSSSPCPSTSLFQGACFSADTRRASLHIPPFDILRRSQHAADAIAAISSRTDASRRSRHETTAHEALDVLEGLVLDGVFVPQVALLPTLTLARRSNDAGVLRRTMELTAAAGMLPKDRQIANALVAFARSGDVAGFVAAEREFLQVRGASRSSSPLPNLILPPIFFRAPFPPLPFPVPWNIAVFYYRPAAPCAFFARLA